MSSRGSKTTLLGNIAFAKNPFEDTFAKGSSAFRFYKSSMDRLFALTARIVLYPRRKPWKKSNLNPKETEKALPLQGMIPPCNRLKGDYFAGAGWSWISQLDFCNSMAPGERNPSQGKRMMKPPIRSRIPAGLNVVYDERRSFS